MLRYLEWKFFPVALKMYLVAYDSISRNMARSVKMLSNNRSNWPQRVGVNLSINLRESGLRIFNGDINDNQVRVRKRFFGMS